MILFQRTIPKISLTFDRDACISPGAKVNHCLIYCSAQPTQHNHFIVKTQIEEWLRNSRDPFERQHPKISIRFEHLPHDDRDRMFHNGYSIMYLQPGFGPVLHWGILDGVALSDLIGMATVIKTFLHYYETDLKFQIAKILQCSRGEDRVDLIHCRMMVQELFRDVSNSAISQRLAYGRNQLYAPPENTSEDEYFHMVWHYMSARAYQIRVEFNNFDLKFLVPQKLFDLFDSCFGQELTYHMIPQGE